MVNTVSGKYRNDTGPLTTSYTSFDAYSIEDVWRQTYESEEQVDVMMVEGQKQTITKGSNIISEKYLAGGEGFDMGGTYGSGEVLVVFQTNANADLLAYVIKTREEIGDENWMEYRHAFMGGMTDEIWNTMQGRFSTILTVSTSSGTITISDGGQSILVDASTHNMRYNADYYTETSDTSTEYSTLQTNGWLVDGTYTYQGVNQDWSNIVESIKAKCVANATITHDTVNGEITMQNGEWSITIMDKDLGASEYLGETADNKERAKGSLYKWGSTSVGGDANIEDWNQTQTIAPVGYHIPTLEEWTALKKMFLTIGHQDSTLDYVENFLFYTVTQNPANTWWTTNVYTQYNKYGTTGMLYQGSNAFVIGADISDGLHSVRCFKDTVNTNMNPGFDEEDI